MNYETLLDLIARTPTAFHAAANAAELLREQGFAACETDVGAEKTGNRFVCRNGSALIAFRFPETWDPRTVSLRITAAHGDSPCFKLKTNPLLRGTYTRLNAEPYGGMIRASWADRPLTLAGRVTVRTSRGLSVRLVHLPRPVAVIPNTAPHLREMNGLTWDPKTDLVPLFGGEEADLNRLLAEHLQVEPTDVVGTDLYLTVYGKGCAFGAENEYISSPRLDDLECVYTCLDGFLTAQVPDDTVAVFALFDNEETGSLSFAGAAGTVLKDALASLLPDPALLRSALARSFFVSADNAHALHPNHPELFDKENAPVMNGGVVIKTNAAQRYMSDGFSAAVFSEICAAADVPVQPFANRSDLRGGSTLGNLSEAQVPVRGVDIGAAQAAMHSAWETAGARDVTYLSDAARAFYSASFALRDQEVIWKG